MARRILEGLDFKITEAEDGEQALEHCRGAMPDAVLLDWNMPEMDGYDFLRGAAPAAGRRPPKVVFCTTENDVAHIARALQRRRQRIHHEAVRQGNRRGQVPGSRADLTGDRRSRSRR